MKILLLGLIVFLQGFEKTFAQKNYFYTNKPYGSEALFNPISLFINGAYDVTQLQMVSNRVGDLEYGKMFKVVMKNLGNPIQSINHYGWKNFFKTEFLPISFKVEDLQWIPNYQQHLIGGGMLYTAMKEWYQQHNYPVPWLLSSITLMSHHILNEVIESGPNEGWSVDEVSDIYLFDLGGIILFSFDNVNEFFSKELNLADWSLQATISFPYGRVNAGQYFSMKWKLPFLEKYSLFYRYGMGGMGGLSKKINETDSFSAGIGFRSKHLYNVSPNIEVRQRTIKTSWLIGAFYDRNNSLLASVVFTGVKEYFCMLDVYPGVLNSSGFSPGLFAVFGRNGNAMFGLTTKYVISLGYETNY